VPATELNTKALTDWPRSTFVFIFSISLFSGEHGFEPWSKCSFDVYRTSPPGSDRPSLQSTRESNPRWATLRLHGIHECLSPLVLGVRGHPSLRSRLFLLSKIRIMDLISILNVCFFTLQDLKKFNNLVDNGDNHR
jgi:hypothetical protein